MNTHVINCKVQPIARSLIFAANLTALREKDGSVRPVAVGNVLRRLASKLAIYRIVSILRQQLPPLQLGSQRRLLGCCSCYPRICGTWRTQQYPWLYSSEIRYKKHLYHGLQRSCPWNLPAQTSFSPQTCIVSLLFSERPCVRRKSRRWSDLSLVCV